MTCSNNQKSIKNVFKKNQILYGKLRPYLRKYYKAEFDGVCSTEIWVIEGVKSKILNEYLFYIIQSEQFNRFANVSSGTKMPRADWNYVSEVVFKLPPIFEQKKIVKILSTWDKAIELKERLIEEKKIQKTGLIQKLYTGKVRIPGFSGKVQFERLNKYIKESKEKNKNNQEKRVLSVTNKLGFVLQEDQFDRIVASIDLSNYKIVRKGQFAYNPSRVNVGSIDLLTTFESGLLSPMYVVFQCKQDLVTEYLYHFIKSDAFLKVIPNFLQGSVRDSLSFDSLGLVKIFIPSVEEQNAIAQRLNLADKEILLLEKELECLKQQKKGLMQLLLTGIVRVNTQES
jgi:type I restriction enzyme S subunit